MAPVVALSELPEREAVGQHQPADAHRELQHACEQRVARGQQRQCLDDADLGVGLHQLRHRYQRLAGHDAVRIEHDHVVVGAAPVAHEFGEVAGLAPDVVAAAAVEHPPVGTASSHQRTPSSHFRSGDLGNTRIGQDEQIERRGGRLLLQRRPDGVGVGEHVAGVLVVHRGHDRSAPVQRLRCDIPGVQHHAVAAHQAHDEARHGGPERPGNPGEQHDEQRQRDDVEHRLAVDLEDVEHQEARHQRGQEREAEEYRAAPQLLATHRALAGCIHAHGVGRCQGVHR